MTYKSEATPTATTKAPPHIETLKDWAFDHRCVAAWDQLIALLNAAEALQESVVGDDPQSFWDCNPRDVRRHDWLPQSAANNCTCGWCKEWAS